MAKKEALVKVVSDDIEVEKITLIEADYDGLCVHMKDGKTVAFTLQNNKININHQKLLAELDMILSEDYGFGVNLDKYPEIANLVVQLRKCNVERTT